MTQESKQKGIDKGESVPLVEQVLEQLKREYYIFYLDENKEHFALDMERHSAEELTNRTIEITSSLVREELSKEIKSLKSAFNECLEDNGKMFKRLKKYEEWTGRRL